MPKLSILNLIAILMATILLALCYRVVTLWTMLKKLRWLFLIMLIVYAFNTPGEYIINGSMSPTFEGLKMGLLQTVKVVVIVISVGLLLVTTSRANLIGALYHFINAFNFFGFYQSKWGRFISPEKFSVRLWLTLHYVENQNNSKIDQSNKNIFEKIQNMFTTSLTDEVEVREVNIPIKALRHLDWAIILFIFLVLIFIYR